MAKNHFKRLLTTIATTFGYTTDGIYSQPEALGQPITVTDNLGKTTHLRYDSQGNAVSVIDALGNETDTAFDIVSYPSYDAQGDVLKRIDGRGVETDYAYSDPNNLMTSKSYPSSSSLNVTYSYDGYGRVTGVTDGAAAAASGDGVVTSYDDDDKVTSVVTTYRGQTSGTYLSAQTISYTYNANGTPASMVTPAGTFTYGYDGDGRSNSLTNPFSESTTWTYLDNGWLKTRGLSNGVTTTNTFNAVGQIVDEITKNSSSSVLSEFSIPTTAGYDGAGNILSRTDTITAATSYSGSTSYTYDSRNQLTQEASTRSSGYTNNFAYDGGITTGAGNPTTFKSATNTFNSDNQYTNTGYTYDGEGNPTTYKGVSLAFDAEDRMVGYGTALTNGYMASGLRAWKQNASGTRTYFLYSGSSPVCELDSSGSVTATNTFGVDGLVSRRVSSTSTFYTFDAQGGNAQRLTASGSVVGSSMFDAYGTGASTDSSTDPFSGYGAKWGYYTDSETGLELCTYRYYDPANGRFINRDPIGYRGSPNAYQYGNNGPTLRYDPLGTSSIPKYLIPVLGGLAGGVIAVAIVAAAPVEIGTVAAVALGIGLGIVLGAAGGAIGGWAGQMSGTGDTPGQGADLGATIGGIVGGLGGGGIINPWDGGPPTPTPTGGGSVGDPDAWPPPVSFAPLLFGPMK